VGVFFFCLRVWDKPHGKDSLIFSAASADAQTASVGEKWRFRADYHPRKRRFSAVGSYLAAYARGEN